MVDGEEEVNGHQSIVGGHAKSGLSCAIDQ